MFSAIFKRELLLFWLSPLPYLTLIALLASCAYFLNRYITSYSQRVEQYLAGFLSSDTTPDLISWVIYPYFETVGFLLMIVVPILVSRTLSEERRTSNLPIILATPISTVSLIFSKFLALYCSVLGITILLFLPVLAINNLEQGVLLVICSASVAASFLVAFYISVSLATSALISSPITSTLIGISVLLILYFLHAINSEVYLSQFTVSELFSPVMHWRQMLQGLFEAKSIGYFLAATSACLLFSMMLLQYERNHTFLDKEFSI